MCADAQSNAYACCTAVRQNSAHAQRSLATWLQAVLVLVSVQSRHHVRGTPIVESAFRNVSLVLTFFTFQLFCTRVEQNLLAGRTFAASWLQMHAASYIGGSLSHMHGA
jgi:hypothetical protein